MSSFWIFILWKEIITVINLSFSKFDDDIYSVWILLRKIFTLYSLGYWLHWLSIFRKLALLSKFVIFAAFSFSCWIEWSVSTALLTLKENLKSCSQSKLIVFFILSTSCLPVVLESYRGSQFHNRFVVFRIAQDLSFYIVRYISNFHRQVECGNFHSMCFHIWQGFPRAFYRIHKFVFRMCLAYSLKCSLRIYLGDDVWHDRDF